MPARGKTTRRVRPGACPPQRGSHNTIENTPLLDSMTYGFDFRTRSLRRAIKNVEWLQSFSRNGDPSLACPKPKTACPIESEPGTMGRCLPAGNPWISRCRGRGWIGMRSGTRCCGGISGWNEGVRSQEAGVRSTSAAVRPHDPALKRKHLAEIGFAR